MENEYTEMLKLSNAILRLPRKSTIKGWDDGTIYAIVEDINTKLTLSNLNYKWYYMKEEFYGLD